ncbi:hypothetical protein L208DRAFT_1381211 [Tricholoma matsutake]|nr:hypothetical protein L208DRAFT_1381211 [Tricholoma matsutake 945]
MPTLDQPPQFPPDLQHENPPSVPNLIAQIDPWVIYHLKTTILSDVHYENQLYGVLNLFHASIYPLRRRFMTIPQGLLRKVLDPDNIDEYLADLSFGSTGGLHESRDLPGSEVHKFVPDFLTVKVTPHRSGPRDHCIVAIVEVK